MKGMRQFSLMVIILMLTACPLKKRNNNSVTITNEESEVITVSLEKNGTEIHYRGPMNHDANEAVKGFLDQNSGIKTLVIDSEGGEVLLGMTLGGYVHDHQLNVRVEKLCFSSCANYIFTADHKYVTKNATVGYHGGVYYHPGMTPEDFPEAFESLKTEEEKKKKWEQLRTYLMDASTKEANFYNRIGVQRRINNIGHADQYRKKYEPMGYHGFTYSKEQFEQLGVNNIHF